MPPFCLILRTAGCLGLNLEQRFLMPEHIAELGDERTLISLWAVNNNREQVKAMGLNADMNTTNIPVKARRLKQEVIAES